MVNLAHTLIADPTFALMTHGERLDEALALMRSADPDTDPDPLDAALAVEEAESLMVAGFRPAEAPAPVTPGLEPCREDRAVCDAPVAGNGRCLECGARRAQEIIAPPAPVAVAREPDKPLRAAKPAAPVLARFKAATGLSDKNIGDMLNLARSTVQATIAGRMPEKLTPSQHKMLAETLSLQLQKAQELAAEITRDTPCADA